MIHANAKSVGTIGEYEPVFMLRAKDNLTMGFLTGYIDQLRILQREETCKLTKKLRQAKIKELLAHKKLMASWRKTNKVLCKNPD